MKEKEEFLTKSWIDMIRDTGLTLEKIKLTQAIIKKIQTEKYLFLITQVRAHIAECGIKKSKKILSSPYVVEFIYHKQDPDFYKAKWFGMIEYMTQADGRVFMPSKKSADPVEKHYNEFLLSIKNSLNSSLPFDKQEAEGWPYMNSWILDERKQLEYVFTIRILEEIIAYQKEKRSHALKPKLNSLDSQETKYAKLIAYMRMCYRNGRLDKFEPGFFKLVKAQEWVGYN